MKDTNAPMRSAKIAMDIEFYSDEQFVFTLAARIENVVRKEMGLAFASGEVDVPKIVLVSAVNE